jgi:Protein of unknown function (DUF1598)
MYGLRISKAWRYTLGSMAALLMVAVTAWAGTQGLLNNRAVGGIAISVDGVLSLPALEDKKLIRELITKTTKAASAEVNQPVELRKISLRRLEAAIHQARQNNMGPLPEEIRFLAGLQRVQYVLVYPEQNDIVLAGPGEGWKVNEAGDVVGITSGLPVMRLDDLLVAFRTVDQARKGGILCSIDPTPEGLKQFETVVKQAGGRMQNGVIEALEKAMGPQNIRVEGVPGSSRFARVLVASDYRMKRYAMDLDKAPVNGLPSFLSLLKTNKGAIDNMMPRWWLACNYEALGKSPDGLAWELRGPGVKVLTESDVLEGGKVKQTGKSSPVAQKWADAITKQYAALSTKDAVFGELRNLMDLCVIAALVEREGLLSKVKLELPSITSSDKGVPLEEFNTPKMVSSQCSVTKSGRDYIITASGGVDISSWQVIENAKEDAAVEKVRTDNAVTEMKSWWWN